MAQTVCDNCRTPQGPFERTVLPITGKVVIVGVHCGFRRKDKPTKEQRLARTRACNERRAALDKTGELLHG